MDYALSVGKYRINPESVDFVHLKDDGSVALQIGANSLHFSGDDALQVRAYFDPPPPDPPLPDPSPDPPAPDPAQATE